MEVRIGIIQSPREISFETEAKAEDVSGQVESALAGGQPSVSFIDTKGKRYVIASSSIAYVEVGAESGRKVGFIN